MNNHKEIPIAKHKIQKHKSRRMPLRSTLRKFDKQKRVEYCTLKPWITSSQKKNPLHPKPKKKRKKKQKIGPKSL
jgi:hypothetical protein